MGKEDLLHFPGYRDTMLSSQVKNRKLSTSNVLTASSSSLLTTISSSLTPSSRLAFSRSSTWVLSDSGKSTAAVISSSSKLSSLPTPRYDRSRTVSVINKKSISPFIIPGRGTTQKPVEKVPLTKAIRTSGSSLASQTLPSCCRDSSSTARDSQKSSVSSEPRNCGPAASVGLLDEDSDEIMEELTAEEIERGRNTEKCLNWIAGLPAKFSGMYILQERAPLLLD